MENNTNKCLIIDVACSVDNNLILKRNEKLDNYSELRAEIARMWDKETLIVPIIIGALGSIPNDLECNLKKLDISYDVETLKKSVLLGTANILRKVLSIKQQRLEKSRVGKREKEGGGKRNKTKNKAKQKTKQNKKNGGLVVSSLKTFLCLKLK